jgi:serine/threonine protein phosphatase PrpC
MKTTSAHHRLDGGHSSRILPHLRSLLTERWERIAGPCSVTFCSAAKSVAGAFRARNEDRCVADTDRGVYLVADGIGGHFGGAEASEIVTGVLPDWLAATAKCGWRDLDIIESSVHNAVDAARNLMIDLAETEPKFRQMGTTLVFGLIVDRKLYLTRVGDCRAYLLHRRRLQRLTKDQTFIQTAIDAGLFTEETARDNALRHVVTNSVGVKPLDEPVMVNEFALSTGDRLLLCSDGLTDAVRDTELQATLRSAKTPQDAVDDLVNLAIERGSRDNVSCIVVDVCHCKACRTKSSTS